MPSVRIKRPGSCKLIAAWLGWVTHEKEGEKVPPQFTAEGCRKLIDDAYMYGVDLSRKGDKLDD